jgi:dihydrofolate synthase / folylpolyglutamate synthase
VALAGRLERRGDGEIRDGAHNLDGVRWLVARLPPGEWVVVASILADKDVDAMLRELAAVGSRFVATRSSSERALPAEELGRLAEAHFRHVDVEPEPASALARARALPGGTLVTGSLYLVGDLAGSED